MLIKRLLLNQNHLSVLNVAEKGLPQAGKVGNFVQEDAMRDITQEYGEKNTQIIGSDIVYNLEVEEQHEYFANTLLVSNCLATTYWRVGMDKQGFGESAIIGSPLRIDAPISAELKPDMTMRHLTIEGKDPIETTLKRLKEQKDDWRDR